MSTTLEFKFRVGGVLTNATSVVLSDEDGTYGVKRLDTEAIVVAAGTAMTNPETGVYRYALEDVDGAAVSWWARVVYRGVTYHFEKETRTATNSGTLSAYNTADDSADFASQLPDDAAYEAASDAVKDAARAMATIDIDRAMPYQGRKYDCDQDLEFPRIDGSRLIDRNLSSDDPPAVVPQKVKLAAHFQERAIIAGTLTARRDRVARGLTSMSTGSLSESYAVSLEGFSSQDILCPEALAIMEKYRLRTGRIL